MAKRKPDPLTNMRRVIKYYKRNAKKRGLEWKLTNQQALAFFKQNCYYCGIEPCQVAKRDTDNSIDFIYNGLDRVDSSKGYMISNIVTCCKVCNTAKNSLTTSEFRTWVNRIYENWANEDTYKGVLEELWNTDDDRKDSEFL